MVAVSNCFHSGLIPWLGRRAFYGRQFAGVQRRRRRRRNKPLTRTEKKLFSTQAFYGRKHSEQPRGCRASEEGNRQGPAQEGNRPYQPAAQAHGRTDDQAANAASGRSNRGCDGSGSGPCCCARSGGGRARTPGFRRTHGDGLQTRGGTRTSQSCGGSRGRTNRQWS